MSHEVVFAYGRAAPEAALIPAWGEHLIVQRPVSGIVESIMSSHARHRRKPALTGHQKQIRFFTRMAVFIFSLLTLAGFWLANRPVPITH